MKAVLVLVLLAGCCFGQDGASNLHKSISTVCPITGVSIGDPNNSSTWIVHYDPTATPSQQSAAKAVLATWTPDLFNGTPDIRRQKRYQIECDPYLIAKLGYDIEAAVAPTGSVTQTAFQAKSAAMLQAYLAAKRKIRQDIPDPNGVSP